MGETRLEKYKKYRQSVNEFKSVNDDPQFIEDRKASIINDKINTTSTLPLEEVLGKIEEPKAEKSQRVITKNMIIIGIISLVGLAIIAGIIVFAIVAWR